MKRRYFIKAAGTGCLQLSLPHFELRVVKKRIIKLGNALYSSGINRKVQCVIS